MIHILVDADACPVKEEIYKVAERYQISAQVVSNSHFRIPDDPLFKRVVVSDKFDAADDYIADEANEYSIVITSDILLAERSIEKRATVLSPTGKPFTENSIGMAVATRSIMADLRAGGEQVGGPAPFSKKDRSRFLSTLDLTIVQMKRRS
ncbi:YaiI/YqxD family protein [Lentilitoribacter sp. Alg239-R112]|uniref:YaiI/YqxD family protein n=1 Tax=Lentilitoribacter sp. Alg239-R112 TaxID=2305987 RepID=UPI0013A6F0EF|nr:YaiI/YqxD family protein [Lentilitoribacter sp. Alg239-R112]